MSRRCSFADRSLGHINNISTDTTWCADFRRYQLKFGAKMSKSMMTSLAPRCVVTVISRPNKVFIFYHKQRHARPKIFVNFCNWAKKKLIWHWIIMSHYHISRNIISLRGVTFTIYPSHTVSFQYFLYENTILMKCTIWIFTPNMQHEKSKKLRIWYHFWRENSNFLMIFRD